MTQELLARPSVPPLAIAGRPPSPRTAALVRATQLRATCQLLAAEHLDVPAGLVLAVAVRCARDLHREALGAGPGEQPVDALDERVRRVLAARAR